MIIRPGAHLTFDILNEKILRGQWESEKLEVSLRMLILVTAMLFHEQGSSRLMIKKLLGNTKDEMNSNDGPHPYGCAADVSIRELIDTRVQDMDIAMKTRFPRATFITRRLNQLFPYGEGSLESATYNIGDRPHLHLQVPTGGFKKSTNCLADWLNVGSVGTPRPYHRKDTRRD